MVTVLIAMMQQPAEWASEVHASYPNLLASAVLDASGTYLRWVPQL